MIVIVVEAASGLGNLSWDGVATVAAGLVAAFVAVGGYVHQQNLARRERRANHYGEALQAVDEYLEAPYLIARRDGSATARMAITQKVSDIQARLSHDRTMMAAMAPEPIADAFDTLVAAARAEAGPQMTAAWKRKPTRRDRDVPLGTKHPTPASDLARDAFLDAVAKHDRMRSRRLWVRLRAN